MCRAGEVEELEELALETSGLGLGGGQEAILTLPSPVVRSTSFGGPSVGA